MSTVENSEVKHSNRWRVIDIVIAAIIAVASGVLFWAWDIVCAAPTNLFASLLPGAEGLSNGFWLFAGPLAAIIVRKPGAALFAETLAAFVELMLGNQWGVGGSLIVGIIQGIGAELAFIFFMYKAWNLLSTVISGALAGLACFLYNWTSGGQGWSVQYITANVITSIISGFIIAGVLMWVVQKALAATGVLDRFESGRPQALV
ncbi:ABC transporter permease [Gardnerella vaginalis]|uniref:ABC transporter permease n=1 Tax=Gardnerella vaginalis TaxID=2702 RepID=A0A3E1J0Y8_GARVA|nr:ECF transporter S component [Gardnerella vaginalis]RFD80026.1 ABC transporter permease [Gardnerella vaginalis]